VAANLLFAENVYEIRVRATELEYDQEIDMITNWTAVDTPVGAFTKTTADMLTTFIAAYRLVYLPNMPLGFKVQRYELREIVGAFTTTIPTPHRKLIYDDLIMVSGSSALDSGVLVGDLLPPYASVSVERRVPKVGRGNYGVLRLGPVLEDQQQYGTLTPAGITAWENAVAFLALPLNIDVGPPSQQALPVLFRKAEYLRSALLADPAAFCRVVSSIDVAERLGTQLSRKEGIRQYGH
jgi:hypothetical protein